MNKNHKNKDKKIDNTSKAKTLSKRQFIELLAKEALNDPKLLRLLQETPNLEILFYDLCTDRTLLIQYLENPFKVLSRYSIKPTARFQASYFAASNAVKNENSPSSIESSAQAIFRRIITNEDCGHNPGPSPIPPHPAPNPNPGPSPVPPHPAPNPNPGPSPVPPHPAPNPNPGPSPVPPHPAPNPNPGPSPTPNHDGNHNNYWLLGADGVGLAGAVAWHVARANRTREIDFNEFNPGNNENPPRGQSLRPDEPPRDPNVRPDDLAGDQRRPSLSVVRRPGNMGQQNPNAGNQHNQQPGNQIQENHDNNDQNNGNPGNQIQEDQMSRPSSIEAKSNDSKSSIDFGDQHNDQSGNDSQENQMSRPSSIEAKFNNSKSSIDFGDQHNDKSRNDSQEDQMSRPSSIEENKSDKSGGLIKKNDGQGSVSSLNSNDSDDYFHSDGTPKDLPQDILKAVAKVKGNLVHSPEKAEVLGFDRGRTKDDYTTQYKLDDPDKSGNYSKFTGANRQLFETKNQGPSYFVANEDIDNHGREKLKETNEGKDSGHDGEDIFSDHSGQSINLNRPEDQEHMDNNLFRVDPLKPHEQRPSNEQHNFENNEGMFAKTDKIPDPHDVFKSSDHVPMNVEKFGSIQVGTNAKEVNTIDAHYDSTWGEHLEVKRIDLSIKNLDLVKRFNKANETLSVLKKDPQQNKNTISAQTDEIKKLRADMDLVKTELKTVNDQYKPFRIDREAVINMFNKHYSSDIVKSPYNYARDKDGNFLDKEGKVIPNFEYKTKTGNFYYDNHRAYIGNDGQIVKSTKEVLTNKQLTPLYLSYKTDQETNKKVFYHENMNNWKSLKANPEHYDLQENRMLGVPLIKDKIEYNGKVKIDVPKELGYAENEIKTLENELKYLINRNFRSQRLGNLLELRTF